MLTHVGVNGQTWLDLPNLELLLNRPPFQLDGWAQIEQSIL